MSNPTGIQLQYPNTIIAPHPRRNHSTPFNYNTHHQIKLNKLHQSHHSKPIKLNQDPGPDEVLSEFLSLFNPSEPIQSTIPILINQQNTLTEAPTSTHHTKANFSPTTPVNANLDPSTPTIQSPTQISSPSPPPLDPSSFSSPHSILNPNNLNQQHIYQNQNDQPGLTIIPNHLSTIVSSPISRCHNPLPRHAELDTLACQLVEPFKSLHPHRDHHDHQEEEREQDTKSAMSEEHAVQNDDDVPSDLMPLLSLDHTHIPYPTMP